MPGVEEAETAEEENSRACMAGVFPCLLHLLMTQSKKEKKPDRCAFFFTHAPAGTPGEEEGWQVLFVQQGWSRRKIMGRVMKVSEGTGTLSFVV